VVLLTVHLFFFFFQAEDGIRDFHVTGVQTCALPIYDNDAKMKQDYFFTMEEMFTAAGFTNIRRNESSQAPGLDIHEMGGVRMGRDPKTSMLNKWNQLHACPNVFITDGACMTSTATQNPSLTYMALSARAVDYAIREK